MPRKLFDENNNAVEVPTDEEIAQARKEAEDRAATAEAKLKEAEADPEKVDWREARKAIKERDAKIKAAEDALARDGKRFNDKNEIIAEPRPITTVDVEKQVAQAIVKQSVDAYIAQFADKDQAVIRKNFQKLTMGEDVNRENVEQFLKEAEMISRPDGYIPPSQQARRQFGSSTGGFGPQPVKDTKNRYTDTDQGNADYENIFGRPIERK